MLTKSLHILRNRKITANVLSRSFYIFYLNFKNTCVYSDVLWFYTEVAEVSFRLSCLIIEWSVKSFTWMLLWIGIFKKKKKVISYTNLEFDEELISL